VPTSQFTDYSSTVVTEAGALTVDYIVAVEPAVRRTRTTRDNALLLLTLYYDGREDI